MDRPLRGTVRGGLQNKEAVQIGTMKGTMDCPEELSSKDLEEKTGRDDWI